MQKDHMHLNTVSFIRRLTSVFL
uniref:Uncharacterized protein n=1 Tax=Anguilla anguilla TaxID=7936 RepID=A0A0E9VMR7_ANGAN